ncbi:MAG: hypothetical protein JHD32_13255, partial [Sphingobium sp.]|nr:hypothetical protein [Sphingobium sp.]
MTLVAFDGYLRPTEALDMRTEDFYVGQGQKKKHVSAVIAPSARGEPAKNKQFDDGHALGAH